MSPKEAMRHEAAAGVQHVYRWLESAAQRTPQVVAVTPDVITAVHHYEARRYRTCLNQLAGVTTRLRQARWGYPTLPPL